MDGNEVRYSCYNILSKLMDIINIEKFIDKFLNERLCDCLNDEDSSVRIQAIATIRHLQKQNNKDCCILKALLA